MTEIVWGPEIPVDGKRPEWLEDDEWLDWRGDDTPFYGRLVMIAKSLVWSHPDFPVAAIRLPADHFAYKAIAAGFTPWAGGEEAPADWDDGDTLAMQGNVVSWIPTTWSRDHVNPIIGYHRRPEPQPDDGEWARIKRGTKEEWRSRFQRAMSLIEVLQELDLIKPDLSPAESLARAGVAGAGRGGGQVSGDWTPGSWSVVVDDTGDRPVVVPSIQASEEYDCAIVHLDGFWQTYWQSARGNKEMLANARLIAAAPDLYEACQSAIPSGVCLINRNIPDDFTVALDCTMGDLRKIAAALARARGDAC